MGRGRFSLRIMNLETERLKIRYLRPDDLEDFFAFRSDPEVCRYQGYPPITYEHARGFLDDLQTKEFGVAGQWVQLALELKFHGKVIGDIGLKPEPNIRIVEFGISMSRDYQGKGLATEGLQAVIFHLFRELGVHRVIGLADVDNARSIALMRRLGFRREGDFRKSYFDQGVWRDECLHAVLAEEWIRR